VTACPVTVAARRWPDTVSLNLEKIASFSLLVPFLFGPGHWPVSIPTLLVWQWSDDSSTQLLSAQLA
jgi:hypothetical protein